MLVDLRDGDNPISLQRLEVSGTREGSATSTSRFASRGAVASSSSAGLSGEVEQAWRSKIQIEVTTEIAFSAPQRAVPSGAPVRTSPGSRSLGSPVHSTTSSSRARVAAT